MDYRALKEQAARKSNAAALEEAARLAKEKQDKVRLEQQRVRLVSLPFIFQSPPRQPREEMHIGPRTLHAVDTALCRAGLQADERDVSSGRRWSSERRTPSSASGR